MTESVVGNTTGAVALVTGAASGMGRIYSRHLAAKGFRVAALDINTDGLAETCDGRDNMTTYECNIASLDEVTSVVARIGADLGEISYGVHCAAIMPGRSVMNEDDTSLRRLTEINYFGALNAIDAIVKPMVARDRGKFVIFGSVAGDALVPNMASYCATKAAVNAYTESLINELKIAGSRVGVHLVKPPAVNTPLVDQLVETETPGSITSALETGRLADPEDIVAQIEKSVEKGKEIIYPGSARFLSLWHSLFPSLWWKTVGSFEKS